MWVGWLGRVLMWFEKLFGRLQDLVDFGSRSWRLLSFFCVEMALAPADWDRIKEQAGIFFARAHRGVAARSLPRPSRLVDEPSRAAYALCTKRANREAEALGAQPCRRCGTYTHSWCETCGHPRPQAICGACDAERLLCPECVDLGKVYPADEGDTETVEVTGYTDAETGEFIPIDPPFRLPLSEVPVTTDGEFDMAALIARARGQRPAGSTGNSS